MSNTKYIVVEGPIGVGKSSLAKILANEFQARSLFERIEDNPFLPKFYKARQTYAFQNQTFFLLNRYQQQMELSQQDLFNQNIIADYLFAKDRIFATLTLSVEELNLYQQIYSLLNARVPKPDLVVYQRFKFKEIVNFLHDGPSLLIEDVARLYLEGGGR